ncbi:MAG: polymer-forming cytoskeletal protein [Deltaproteobacteria bacterium]|nr:polymer-forming cytoskeletal protein [Deltaproteobacteria bacterium]MBW2660472.1 polymer-forming cytoskeletal protein [Deltaproteobacteria bacterium]
MWNKTENISIIDKGLIVDGTISAKGKLVIKGTVKGTLVGETVIVAEEGVVCADTKATSITIGGIFDGELEVSNQLIILSTGSCTGKVVYNNLIVESGGKLNAAAACTVAQKTKK